MVVDPIAVDYDLEGRLWVIEMLGFMPDTSGTIRANRSVASCPRG